MYAYILVVVDASTLNNNTHSIAVVQNLAPFISSKVSIIVILYFQFM